MKIAFACDHGGFSARNAVFEYFTNKGIEVVDYGTFSDQSVDYPEYAKKVCLDVVNKKVDKGVLICGTGIGMSIVANKIKGIRCAHVTDIFSAEMTRRHNDTNVIALGARITSEELIVNCIDVFLNTEFDGGRHANRVCQISKIEEEFNV